MPTLQLRRAAFALCTFALGNATAQVPLEYRSVKQVIEVRPAAEGAQKAELSWTYPRFLKGHPGKIEALNTWARDLSISQLEACVDVPPTELRKMSDQQIRQALTQGDGLTECGLFQSELEPQEAFGRYVSLRLYVTSMGNARPSHGIETFLFDQTRMHPVPLESLFKPNALEELNEVLAAKIQGERPDCPGRRFGWWQATLRPPASLFISYAYDPAEWAMCGDGVEGIEGPPVRRQLLNPRSLQPLRHLLLVP